MENENNKQLVITEEEIEEMKNIIAEEVIANDEDNKQVREIVTCRNIQMGDKKKIEFKGVLRLNGKFIPKVGRPLGLKELEKEMPEMFEAIENIEGSPFDAIEEDKEFTAELQVAGNETRALKRIELNILDIAKEQGPEIAQMIKEQLLEQRESRKKEIKKVEELGVEWNENLVWDIWMIKRAERQRKYMEDEGLPVDYLIELYSYIPKGEYKRIKKHYQKQFE